MAFGHFLPMSCTFDGNDMAASFLDPPLLFYYISLINRCSGVVRCLGGFVVLFVYLFWFLRQKTGFLCVALVDVELTL